MNNLAELHRKLIATARGIPADDRVPYAFEKRVMARLRASAPMDVLAAWSRALWRGAISCVVVTLLAGVWAIWLAQREPQPDMAKAFETAVFASTSPDDAW